MISAMTNPSYSRLARDLDYVLKLTGSLWEELRGQRIFITGGTGFLGSWLLESFSWANKRFALNAQAFVLTRDFHRFSQRMPHLACDSAIKFVCGDVRSFEFPRAVFSHVIHAANDSRFDHSPTNPLLELATIMEGTRRVLDFAVNSGSKKLLLISSGAVYGRQLPEMNRISEEYRGGPNPLDSESAYAEGKRCAELLCVLYARDYDLKVKIGRCFTFVGPYLALDGHYAIGNFIHDGLRGGPIVVQSDGTPCRSYLYAADLAAWLWTILFAGKSCEPYNIGSDKEVTIAELAALVAEVCGGVKVHILRPANPGAPPDRYIPDITRAKTELGLESGIDLYDAIRRTIDFYGTDTP
jgi:nucleoside-diphosphate-sugar epimerase